MPPLVLRATDDRVQPEVGAAPTVELPRIGVADLDDVRRLVLQPGGHPPFEHVGRLDDVIVDRHQDEVVHLHVGFSPRLARSPQ